MSTKKSIEVRKIKPGELNYPEKDTRNADRGQYGVVRKATWKDVTVAVKSFYPDRKSGFEEELLCLTKLKHPNIVYMHGAWWDDAEKEQRLIVLEYAPLTLEKVLYDHHDYEYTDNHVIHWSRQIVCGLEYIHEQKMIHRDVKPSNILLFENGLVLKLCDFGTTKVMESTLTNAVGTIRYMAPEVIKGKHYTASADIFSFAITLWEMIARKRPTLEMGMEKADSISILYKMANGGRPVMIRGLPKFLEEIMTRCWEDLPENRPTTAVLRKKLDTLCEKYFKKHEQLAQKTSRKGSVPTESPEVTQENTEVTLTEVTQRENTEVTQRENTEVTQRENIDFLGTTVDQAPTPTITPSWPAGIVSESVQPAGNQPGAGNQPVVASTPAGNLPANRSSIGMSLPISHSNSSPMPSVSAWTADPPMGSHPHSSSNMRDRANTDLPPHKFEGHPHQLPRQVSTPVEGTFGHHGNNHPQPWPYHGGGGGGYGLPGPHYHSESPFRHAEGMVGGGYAEVANFEMDEEAVHERWRYQIEEQPRQIQEFLRQRERGEFPRAEPGTQYSLEWLDSEWQPIIPDWSEESKHVYGEYIKLAKRVVMITQEVAELLSSNSRVDKEISDTQDALKESRSLQSKKTRLMQELDQWSR